MAVGGSGRGGGVVSVAVLAVALAVAGCGGGGSAGRSAPSSTAAAQAPATTSGSGARQVKATVSGRAVVGQCVGRKTGAPTVVLEVGMGAPRDALLVVEDHLAKRTQVCSYDRAGKGASDPASKPRPVTEVVSDLHAFLAAVNKPPYFLVGHSFGARVVFLYAQAHPDQVAGFVAINPGPPYRTWLRRARTIQTEAEVQAFELPFLQGDNAEGINLTTSESMLTDPLPADLPYAVMFDASCEDLPPPRRNPKACAGYVRLSAVTAQELAKVGKGGRFVWAKGGGHFLQVTQPEAVLATVDQVWKAAAGR
jgi:pimeloyl-ACP methyl ester carboxylesterase